MRKTALVAGDRGGGARGPGDPAVVIAGRIRLQKSFRRRAGRGDHERRARGHVLSSSPSKRERGGAKERRKPVHRWQNREHGGGHPQERSGESRSLGAPVDGRRLGPGMSRSLTRAWQKRSYQHDRVVPPGAARRGATGDVRHRSSASHAADNAAAKRSAHHEWPSPKRSFGSIEEQQTTRGSWGRAVKRDPPGAWPSGRSPQGARIIRPGVDAARTSVRCPVGHRAATPR
jgi:hypothetical protein